ncbi:hypothetical protein V6N11_012880 [Hibiscus sabdariffa]|uniref:Uncharacterized protein n=1 Tax=Hibiscus sabdariffa TaxID=183260 RepID=A0ABR1ZVF2_9ROSI
MGGMLEKLRSERGEFCSSTKESEAHPSRPKSTRGSDLFTIPIVPGVEWLWRADNSTTTNVLQDDKGDASAGSVVASDVAFPSSSVVPSSICQTPFHSPQSRAGGASPATLLLRSSLLNDNPHLSMDNSSPATLLPRLSQSYLPMCDVGMDRSNNVGTEVGSKFESPLASEPLEPVNGQVVVEQYEQHQDTLLYICA